MWYNGLLQLSIGELILAVLLLTHLTIISVTIYLHRYSAHNALELHPVLQHIFRAWLWLTTGMTTKAWTAIHRKHHAKCETEEDPHSPVIKGIKKVFWQGAELYREEAENEETLERYGQRTPNDWIENNVYSRFPSLGVSLLLIVDLLMFGIIGLTVWAIQMIWIPFFAAGVINGLGHHTGYRNFECKDAARNICPWGILIGGEELHNNHHTFPNSPKLSAKPWEFDIGWLYIKILCFLKLADVKHKKPVSYTDNKKKHIDTETIMAVINNRFQIMVHYRKQVISPIIKIEKSLAKNKKLFRRAHKLLAREASLVKPAHQERITHLLEHSHILKTIYEKRIALQSIWQNTFKDKHERVEALKDWCQQAETSGIKALADFAALLRSYRLASPVSN
ncbi:DesA family fatty acid desaturase [Spartinivicinus poritis]|uniref:Fatty acid desaturase n=1 Tax=Spartinivicinus poritis TaxID=2994640 RepID=A0ABT5UB24_9GAMM|nr:fatty acid desaturase [Spartinivicinus sp. A2-2]MDE1463563.1 fatty acid desaturase [Spartinivicinus sp. A2-2]